MVSLSADVVPGYQEQSRQLNANQHALRTATMSVLAALSDEQLRAWEETLAPTAQLVRASLLKAMLTAPELHSELEAVSQEIEADLLFQPLLERVNAAYGALRKGVLEHRFFRSQAAMRQLTQARDAALSAAEASTVDPMYRGELEGTLANLMRAAEGLLAQQARFKPCEVVARMVAQQAPILAQDCRDPQRRHLRNCDLLKSVAFLSTEHVELMTEAELHYVENTLDAASQGPLTHLEVVP